MSEAQKYPEDLCDAPPEKIAALKLRRDNRGRLRTPLGGYVCEVSGTVHTKRLYSVPDRRDGEWARLWVSEAEARRAGIEAGGGFLPELGELILKVITK